MMTARAGTPATRLGSVVLMLAASTACAASSNDITSGGASSVPAVDAAQPQLATMELTTFDGATLRLQDLAGTPVVVNFFASWCGPCVREMPEIEAVKQQLGDRVTFLGVNVMDDVERADKLVADTGVTWLLVRDPGGDYLTAAGGRAMPTTLVVDAEGRVVEARSGGLDADELLDMLRAAGVASDG